ncbi:MAG: elongation factor P [Pseudomonadaceae bacterium]|nr:elongation factor P [Pseudomonadaceae bacterium]
MAKVDCISVRVGNILDYDGKLCRVSKTDHVTPGRRMAVAHIQMKDIRTGVKYEQRYNSGMEVERVTLESRKMQYLFSSGETHTFMDTTSYEQVEVPNELLDGQEQWLAENMEVDVDFYEESPVSITLPAKVEGEVAETEAVVKGQTASSSFKPAKLTNGATVMVPPYITEGTRIIVSTADSSFVSRA